MTLAPRFMRVLSEKKGFCNAKIRNLCRLVSAGHSGWVKLLLRSNPQKAHYYIILRHTSHYASHSVGEFSPYDDTRGREKKLYGERVESHKTSTITLAHDKAQLVITGI